jgi:hypothetical protein
MQEKLFADGQAVSGIGIEPDAAGIGIPTLCI